MSVPMRAETSRREKNSLTYTPNKNIGSIWKPGTRYVASHSSPTLSNVEANPRVTKLIGMSSMCNSGRTTPCKKVSTILANRSVTQFEIETVGKTQANIPSAMAVLSSGRNIYV